MRCAAVVCNALAGETDPTWWCIGAHPPAGHKIIDGAGSRRNSPFYAGRVVACARAIVAGSVPQHSSLLFACLEEESVLEPLPEAPDVALFIDLENIRYSLNHLGAEVDPTRLIDKARRYGKIAVALAY